MAQGQRRLDDGQQAIDLPLEPAVVEAELADIFDDQAQQVEQGVLDLDLLFGGKQRLLTEAGQAALNLGKIDRRLAQRLQQSGGQLANPVIVGAQRGQNIFDEARQL